MRKIYKEILELIALTKSGKKGNCTVQFYQVTPAGYTVTYKGHKILHKDLNGNLWLSHCGHITATTRNYLNFLVNYLTGGKVYTKDCIMHYQNAGLITELTSLLTCVEKGGS